MLRLPRGLKHTVWSLLDTISYPVVFFAATPYLMRYMGTVVFGFWMVLNTVTVVLQLANLNLGYTAMRHIAYERSAGRERTVTDIINSLLKITGIQAICIIAAGCVAALILSRTGWLGNYAQNFRYGAACFFLAAVLAGLKYFEQIFQNIVKSYEGFKATAILNIAYRTSTLGATLCIVVFFPGMIVFVLLGNVLLSVCYLAVHYAYIHRLLPFYKAMAVQERGLRQRLLSYSVWPWIQSVIIVLTFQADRFWVSGYAGLQEVSAYGLIATMFNHIHMIFTAMIAWVSPRIISLYAKGASAETEYNFIRSLLTVVTIMALLMFYWLSPVIFQAWLGTEAYGWLKDYVQGFTGFELAFVHTIVPVFYLNGTGRERAATRITVICCCVCYLLMLGGLWLFNSPVALVRGMTIGACLTVPVFNMLSDKYIAGHAQGLIGLLKMIPVFAAIGLIYVRSPWLMLAFIVAGGWALWKYYTIHLIKPKAWKQVLGAG